MPSSVGLQVCQRPSYCIYRTAPKHHLCMHAAPTLLRGVRHARLWAAAQLRMSLEMHYIRLSVRGLALPYAVRYSSAAPFLPRSFCLYRYRFSFSPSVFLLFFFSFSFITFFLPVYYLPPPGSASFVSLGLSLSDSRIFPSSCCWVCEALYLAHYYVSAAAIKEREGDLGREEWRGKRCCAEPYSITSLLFRVDVWALLTAYRDHRLLSPSLSLLPSCLSAARGKS